MNIKTFLTLPKADASAFAGFPDWLDVTEASIISKVVEDALAMAGVSISVEDEEGDAAVIRSRDRQSIRREVAATGETWLSFYDTNGDRVGWVRFIHGNGVDVLSDYSANMWTDALVTGATNLADQLSAA